MTHMTVADRTSKALAEGAEDDTAAFEAGQLVEVRSADEIRATLDERGELEALPFMPEMLAFCGRRYRIFRRADKSCDTIAKYVARRMHRTVHLAGLRCDGSGHDGCQAGCLLYWKEAWLRPVDEAQEPTPLVQIEQPGRLDAERANIAAFHEELTNLARTVDAEGVRYTCQATEMLRASEPLDWWDIRQYVRDIRTGNVTALQFLRGTWYAFYAAVRRRLTRSQFPVKGGTLTKTPTERLDLQPGELVQVKSRKEIIATLDTRSKNRGLWYDVEMWRFSGGTYRVHSRVERIINEKTGRMINIPGPCVILEGVVCSGERSRNRLFCPRSIYPYWREIWLRRVTP